VVADVGGREGGREQSERLERRGMWTREWRVATQAMCESQEKDIRHKNEQDINQLLRFVFIHCVSIIRFLISSLAIILDVLISPIHHHRRLAQLQCRHIQQNHIPKPPSLPQRLVHLPSRRERPWPEIIMVYFRLKRAHLPQRSCD